MSRLKLIWAIYQLAYRIIDYIDRHHAKELDRAIDEGVITGDHILHEKLLGHLRPGAPAEYAIGVRFESDAQPSATVEWRPGAQRDQAQVTQNDQSEKSGRNREAIVFDPDVS